MIVAGEASGDMHGARLVEAMLARRPDLIFSGMGGRELATAGVTMLYDASRLAVVGITEVLSHLPDILAARRSLVAHMRRHSPSLLILIDYPDFNLLLAAKAKKLGIPVFYYISPQVWAWRSGRVKKIDKVTDRVAVILPFEKDFYAQRGVNVDFVGHPLLDTVQTTCSRQQFLERQNIDPSRKIIGLLPGSRSKEITAMLPDFLAAARMLADGRPEEYTFLLPVASTVSRPLLEEYGLAEHSGQLDIRVITEQRFDAMAACDVALAASGTVTLELAILEVPTITTYKVSPRTYLLGRLLVRNLDFFSLVNLVAGRQIIPELLQDQVTPANICTAMRSLLDVPQTRQTMIDGLKQVKTELGGPGASRRAADIALHLADGTLYRHQPQAESTVTTSDDPIHLPINGTLDLHTFRPGEIKFLIPDYLEECRQADILHVRIVHGKGTGTLRRTVHAILGRLAYVKDYRLAGEDAGSWGATLVDLREEEPPA